MGKISKGIDCSIDSCDTLAKRSVSRKNLGSSDFSISSNSNRVYLCSEHYKSWKKSTKETRESERARY